MSLWDDFRSAINPLPGIGTVGQMFWGSPEEERLQDAIKKSSEELQRVRPLVRQQQMQQMRQAGLAMQPTNALIGRMYGPQYMVDYNQVFADPTPPGMFGPVPPPVAPTDVPTPQGTYFPRGPVRTGPSRSIPGKGAAYRHFDPTGVPTRNPLAGYGEK